MDKFKVTKSNRKLCMLMACKNHEALYVRLISDELKSSEPDFDRLCNDVSEIQRLTRSGDNVPGMIRKLISPQWTEMVHLVGNASSVEKLVGTGPKNAGNAKDI